MNHVDISNTINLISICTGGAGLERGFSLIVENTRTICYVEREAFACEYLAEEMDRSALDAAPIWTDIRTFKGKPWRDLVDGIVAGYPCQPFSFAGSRRGCFDPRYIWPHIPRIARECCPSFLILENVQGHVTMGLDTVITDLDALGYEIAAGLFSAAEVGANHLRQRVFIVAIMGDANCSRWSRQLPSLPRCRNPITLKPSSYRLDLFPFRPDDSRWSKVDWRDVPSFAKIRLQTYGLANEQLDWLRLFGNGVVPLAAANAISALWSVVRTRKAVEL